MAQVVTGLGWSALFAAGEWAVTAARPSPGAGRSAAALVYVAVGPAILAYRCWGLGVQRAGPRLPAFSQTSLRCLRRSCRQRSWVNRRSPTTALRSS